MTSLQAICEFLTEFAPLELAEEWDNVGLLVGDGTRPVKKLMTCLTVTPAVAAEASQQNADLIVTHHPVPFRPLKSITSNNTVGRLLLHLIRNNIAVYSPHTAFDSAKQGINQQLAERIGLLKIQPLVPAAGEHPELGTGRVGEFPSAHRLSDVIENVKRSLAAKQVGIVGSLSETVTKVAVACGSAGQFLEPARRLHCDLFITGESNFHTCLESEAIGLPMLLTGHFASERFALDSLARILQEQYPELTVWASTTEKDPLVWG